MPLDPGLQGRRFTTEAYAVTGERVSAFARATGTPWSDGDPAPATFPIVVAFDAMQQLLADPAAGIALENVVHGDQKFSHSRPIVVGDQLRAELEVTSVRSLGGADVIVTSSTLVDADDQEVCVARATLVHRGGAA